MTRRSVKTSLTSSSHEKIEDELADLRVSIENGSLDTETIANYVMFCELGGEPDEFLRSKVEAAMDYLRVLQERDPHPQGDTTFNDISWQEPDKQIFANPALGLSQRIDGAAVRDIAVAVSDLVGSLATSYWKFRSDKAESEAAEKRLRAAQLEVEAARTREDTRQSTAMWTQLGVWSLTTAAKFWTDYTMKCLSNEHSLARDQLQASRGLDKESRRSERFDQLLIWGGKTALETGARYLLQG